VTTSRILTGAVAALSLTCGVATVRGAEKTALDSLAGLFDARQREGFSGVVLLARGDQLLFEHAYGSAGCPGAEPMSRDHVFLIGSITKVFTRAALYKLVEEGKLGLDDPLSRFLPGVPADKAAITIGQVAAHRAGFDDILDEDGKPIEYSVDWDYLPTTREQIVERGLRSRLIFEPGTDKKYSNLGYSLLAAVIERASGTSYEAYVRRSVLVPAGMHRTGYVLPDWSEARFADGCVNGETWKMPLSAGRWMEDGPSWNLRGNGGMMGTARDLLAWLSALSRGRLLRPGLFEQYIEATTGTSRTFQERAAGAAGGNGIFNSYYLWLKRSDLRLVMISNVAEHQVESYLDDLYPLLKRLR
jgi:CubicO group peptidase (beta-lactamase class C family)